MGKAVVFVVPTNSHFQLNLPVSKATNVIEEEGGEGRGGEGGREKRGEGGRREGRREGRGGRENRGGREKGGEGRERKKGGGRREGREREKGGGRREGRREKGIKLSEISTLYALHNAVCVMG